MGPRELASLRTRARRVLAVFPHPDDESYGPAGTLHRIGRDPDAATVVYVMTRGEASSIGPERGLDPKAVGDLREKRLRQVSGILGLDALLVGDFPDGRMARCDLGELSAAIREVLDALRPQVVVGHDVRGANAHPDHIATHWAVRHALLGRDPVRFAMLAYPPEVAEAVRPRLLFPTPEEEIDAVIALTEEEIEAKERCLEVHEAIVTLRAGGNASRILRPPVERYDFLGEDRSPPVADLFA